MERRDLYRLSPAELRKLNNGRLLEVNGMFLVAPEEDRIAEAVAAGIEPVAAAAADDGALIEPEVPEAPKKRGMSDEAKAKIGASARARWAKLRKRKKNVRHL